MEASVVKGENAKNLKLQRSLKNNVETVDKLTAAQAQDLQLGITMKIEKTGKAVSRQRIFHHLDS